MCVYNPATISAADLHAIMARLDRYLARHGSAYGETPIPADTLDDVRQGILADWLGDDWTAREFEYISRNGRTLFPASLSTLGRHLRGMLFHAGRARRRCWRAAGAKRGEASRRRGLEDFQGAGSASRAADPALVVAAVESASGVPVLSKAAQRNRARRGLALKFRGGVPAVSSKAPKAFRVMKRRNAGGWIVEVVSRHQDRTCIAISRWTRYNFQRVGAVPHRIEWTDAAGRWHSEPNPVRRPAMRKLPKGVNAATIREALVG